MIKISKKIWTVKGVRREDDLAYMAPYDETNIMTDKMNYRRLK